MSAEVEQLVRETVELTGAEEPSLLAREAPVLDAQALASSEDSFYLVGLIGGKDVGKSSLVNALAGRNITTTSAYGPGTEVVIAYAHASQEPALRDLLQREVPGQFTIVTHKVPELRRQILVDLPDIDSHFASHLQVTRTMLWYMLFPMWLVSVEKYADLQPQRMLSQVAQGNTPDNFIFCLNKVDQLGAGPQAVAELQEDYAKRVQRTLSLAGLPAVYMISAAKPDQFDLPRLRQVLSREKSREDVHQSQELAARRQENSLLSWLQKQQLPQRARRLAELEEQLREVAAERIAGPLVDSVIPRLLEDPQTCAALSEQILTERVARWPVVRLVHTLLSPLFLLLRGATARNAAPLRSPEGLVEIVLKESDCSPADLVQSTFAHFRQSHPELAGLYSHSRLWEQMPADIAAAELRRTLGSTIQRQREAARSELIRREWIGAPLRWLLTIGAILWFPFIQPILHAVLGRGGSSFMNWAQRLQLLVEVLGVDYLLKSAAFLILYFLAIWLALRWNTQRKVAKAVTRLQSPDLADESINLYSQTLAWLDSLIAPVHQARQRMESLAARAEAAKERVTKAA